MTKKDNNTPYPACDDCEYLLIPIHKTGWRNFKPMYKCAAQGYRDAQMVYGNNHCLKVFKPYNRLQIKE